MKFDINAYSRMNVLQSLVANFKESQPLSGVDILLIQHQLENHYAQAKALIEVGAEPDSIFWIDIPYSSHQSVREKLYDLGIPKSNFMISNDFKLSWSYTRYQRQRVQQWIHRYQNKLQKKKKLVFLDDGSYFPDAAVCFNKKIESLAGVEQTMRGISRINGNPAVRAYCQQFPLVDVATSQPKTEIESKYISESVTSALFETSAATAFKKSSLVCLILGYGNIGKAIAQALVTKVNLQPSDIFIFDTDQKKMQQALQKGHKAWDKTKYNLKFGLVIGCSGKCSFTTGDFIFLENEAFLISASSGSHELSREAYIELANSSTVDDVEILNPEELEKNSVHTDIRLRLVDRMVTLVNGGFPINFNGKRINRIPAEKIQITVSMMVRAAIQAAALKSPGIHALDKEFCKYLVSEFKK